MQSEFAERSQPVYEMIRNNDIPLLDTMKRSSEKTGKQVHLPLLLSSRFTNAVDYARRIHTEYRKGTVVPYMAHLLGVAALVMGEAGETHVPVTEDMVIAAILHDAAEDHGGLTRLKDIENHFGNEVARMVEGLSDSLTEESVDKAPWPERKKAYITRLRGEPADVQLISAADKLYNACAILADFREIGPEVWKRFKRGHDDQIWYFHELLKVFNASEGNRIVAELERVTSELERISAEEKR
jgi:(p)ppGpp synthase/HD superfamily hydrolase